MTPTPLWTSRVGDDDGTRTVSLAGEIDMAAADSVRALLVGELEQLGTTTVTADLTELIFLTPPGWGRSSTPILMPVGPGRIFGSPAPASGVARVMKITGVFGILTGAAEDLSDGLT